MTEANKGAPRAGRLLRALIVILAGVAALHGAAPAKENPSGPPRSASADRRSAPAEASKDEDQEADEGFSVSLDTRLDGTGDDFAMFNDIHVPAGEVRRGDVVCLFGDVTVEGKVSGEVVVIGGSLIVAGSGSVGGNAVVVLGNVTLNEGAEIGEDLVNVLGRIDNQGRVHGGTVDIPLVAGPFDFKTPFGMLGALIFWGVLAWALVKFLVILLMAALVPERIRTLSDETPVSILLAYLVGLGGYVVYWVVMAVLVLSVIGMPLSFLLWVTFIGLKWLGLAGIYHYVGRSFGRLVNREFSLLGAILVGFLPFALLVLLPMFIGGIGWLVALGIRFLFWLLVEIPAVGLVILTRGGSRPRKAAGPPIPLAPASPTPPPEPAGAPPVISAF